MSFFDFSSIFHDMDKIRGSKKREADGDANDDTNSSEAKMKAPTSKKSKVDPRDMSEKAPEEDLSVGKLCQATVVNFKCKKPQADELVKAAPVRKEGGEMWQCPFCHNDFPELIKVYDHIDSKDEETGCRGKCYGVSVRLDNGINGMIHLKNFSDKKFLNPEKQLKRGERIYVRVLANKKNFVECSSKSSDLKEEDGTLEGSRPAVVTSM